MKLLQETCTKNISRYVILAADYLQTNFFSFIFCISLTFIMEIQSDSVITFVHVVIYFSKTAHIIWYFFFLGPNVLNITQIDTILPKFNLLTKLKHW